MYLSERKLNQLRFKNVLRLAGEFIVSLPVIYPVLLVLEKARDTPGENVFLDPYWAYLSFCAIAWCFALLALRQINISLKIDSLQDTVDLLRPKPEARELLLRLRRTIVLLEMEKIDETQKELHELMGLVSQRFD